MPTAHVYVEKGDWKGRGVVADTQDFSNEYTLFLKKMFYFQKCFQK